MQVIEARPGPVDDPGSFVAAEWTEPDAGANDLLIDVQAVSVNPIDTKVRQAPLADGQSGRVLGFDACGTVAAVGSAARRFAVGDPVFYAGSVKRDGSNAQRQVVDARLVGHKPHTLDAASAAAMPLTALTAWEALFEHLGIGGAEFGGVDDLGRAHTLLIVGGAGGVGSMAIQLAKMVPGLVVVATASRPDSVAWCEQLGADHVVNHRNALADEFRDRQLQAPDYVLLNTLPDPYFLSLVKLLAPLGRICSIVDSREPLDLMKLRNKAGRFAWQGMFTRSNWQTSDMIKQGLILDRVAALTDQGILRNTHTTDFGRMTPENLATAHAAVQAGSMIGKGTIAW